MSYRPRFAIEGALLALLLAGCDVPLDALCFAERCAGRCVNDCGEHDMSCCDTCESGSSCTDPTKLCLAGPDFDDPRTCETIYGRTYRIQTIDYNVPGFDGTECWDPDEEGCVGGQSGGASLPDTYATVLIDDVLVVATEPIDGGLSASLSIVPPPEITLTEDTRATLEVRDEDGDVDALVFGCMPDAIGVGGSAAITLSCANDEGRYISLYLPLVP